MAVDSLEANRDNISGVARAGYINGGSVAWILVAKMSFLPIYDIMTLNASDNFDRAQGPTGELCTIVQ